MRPDSFRWRRHSDAVAVDFKGNHTRACQIIGNHANGDVNQASLPSALVYCWLPIQGRTCI